MMTTLLARRTHPDDPGEPQHGRPRVGIAPDEERILAALAVRRTVLEIGTGLGYSTRALARTAATVDTFDPDPWVAKTIAPSLPGNVSYHRTWPAVRGPWAFDLVFIDADHAAPAVEADLRQALPSVRPDGLIVLHDWTADPGVARGARAALQGRSPVVEIATTYGLGLVIVDGSLP